MNNSRRSRSRPSIGAEFLESRHLLNAHVPHHAAVHVAAASAPATKAPHELSGTLNGLATYTLNPLNYDQGYDAYSLTASTKNGVASYSGTDSFTSTLINPTTFHDVYFNGFTVLTLADNSSISINYVGTGKSPLSSGPYSATFTGEAIGITGVLTGHSYSFKATLTGNEVDASATIKFTLKD